MACYIFQIQESILGGDKMYAVLYQLYCLLSFL